MILKKLLFVIIMWCVATPMRAQTGEKEANLKAAFIYSFTKYIDWGNYNDKSEFVIGVIGADSPVIPPLQEIARTSKINDKRIEIRIINDLSDIKNCDILFITKECSFPLKEVLDRTGQGMLTISESKGFAAKGTDFNFVIVNQKLKFEANLVAINSSGLKAGSQLLKLAIIVNQD